MAYLRNLISLKCLDLRRFQMISLGRQGITWPHLMTLVMVVKMGFTYINQAKLFPGSQYNPVIRWGLHHREHGHGINVLGLCYNVFQEFHVQFFDATADAASALD